MHRLSREIRFSINATPDTQSLAAPANTYAGAPALNGLGYFFTIAATVSGQLDPRSNYLLNIQDIDTPLRSLAIPLIEQNIRDHAFGAGGTVALNVFRLLRQQWPNTITLEQITLNLSPFQAWTILAPEYPMIRLSQQFEFAAAHRLHNPDLSDDENRRLFGKCNNPHGHGHNYQLQVTLTGTPDANGALIPIHQLESLVIRHAIEPFDHKHLNIEVPEFAHTIPSVEIIAQAIYHRLKPHLQFPHARLAAVIVWETPKTWCEYTEP